MPSKKPGYEHDNKKHQRVATEIVAVICHPEPRARGPERDGTALHVAFQVEKRGRFYQARPGYAVKVTGEFRPWAIDPGDLRSLGQLALSVGAWIETASKPAVEMAEKLVLAPAPEEAQA